MPDDIRSTDEALKGGMILKERHLLENLIKCKECITPTLSAQGRRLNKDTLSVSLEGLFDQEAFRDLCHGYPLEKV